MILRIELNLSHPAYRSNRDAAAILRNLADGLEQVGDIREDEDGEPFMVEYLAPEGDDTRVCRGETLPIEFDTSRRIRTIRTEGTVGAPLTTYENLP